MQVLRPATLALVFACAAGCRTAGVSDLARPDPVLAAKGTSATEILAAHNRNAERIEVLKARPDLIFTVYDKPNRPPSRYPVDGRLALERPRNFKLDIAHTATKVADIGSNDEEYWFWVKDRTQRVIYYCNYDEMGANAAAAGFQPDWIIEAMGLRVIPKAEAAGITVRTDETGRRLVLTHRPHTAGGASYTRMTLVDKATHQIVEHQLRSADQKTLLARAEVPEGYETHPISAEATRGAGESVLIPKRLKLYWIQEKLDLDVTFRNVEINKPITQAQRELLFVEPQLGRGYTRQNLAEAPPTTTIRESRPAPPSGVRLSDPTPIEGESAARREERSHPIALNGAEPAVPSLVEDVVGARFPAAPEPVPLTPETPGSGWRAATGPGTLR
jgi:outer membrane lipoprotein-sorting protein